MVNNLVFHSNQKVSLIIDKKAFEDVINSLSKTIEGIKINEANDTIITIVLNSESIKAPLM